MLIPQILYQIGHAICHQIPERSFFVYGEQLPLCSRCTGIYLGMFIAFSFYFFTKILKNKKPIKPPALWINVLSIFFILLMATQAIFSISMDYFDKEIRFITGLLFGISLPWYLLLTVNYTKRFKYENKEILNYKEYVALFLFSLIIAIIFLFKIPIILYLSAYISIFGLLIFIFSINLSLLILIADNIKKFQKISFYYLLATSFVLLILEIITLNSLHSVIL